MIQENKDKRRRAARRRIQRCALIETKDGFESRLCLTLHPGADASAIRMTRVNSNGLIISLSG